MGCSPFICKMPMAHPLRLCSRSLILFYFLFFLLLLVSYVIFYSFALNLFLIAYLPNTSRLSLFGLFFPLFPFLSLLPPLSPSYIYWTRSVHLFQLPRFKGINGIGSMSPLMLSSSLLTPISHLVLSVSWLL